MPRWPSVRAQRADPEPRSKEYYNGRLADRSMPAVRAKRAHKANFGEANPIRDVLPQRTQSVNNEPKTSHPPVRSSHLARQDRGRRYDIHLSSKPGCLFARRSSEFCFLYRQRRSEAHRAFRTREGSYHRRTRNGRFLWRGMFGRPNPTHGAGRSSCRKQDHAIGEGRNDQPAS